MATASYSLKDVILFDGKFHEMLPKDSKLISVPYYELRDIKDSCFIQEKTVLIHINFNLLAIVEYTIAGIRNYRLFIDNLHKNISISKKLYGLPKMKFKYKNIIDDIKCITDFDAKNNIISQVNESIKCMLAEDGATAPDLDQLGNQDALDKEIITTENSVNSGNNGSSSQSNDAGTTGNLCSIVKEDSAYPANSGNDDVDSVSESNDESKGDSEGHLRPEKVNLQDSIEGQHERLRSDYYKLCNNLKDKDSQIN